MPVTIADLAINDTDFSSLLAAVGKAQLATALADLTAKYTVFAPVNSAFNGIDLNALTEAQAAGIVTTHVINTLNVLSTEVSGFTAAPVQSLNADEKISLKITSGSVFVSSDGTMDSKVIAADVQAVNGIIHGVDKVLIP
jgi:transforming growth factor-beta-induced protein